MSFQENIKQWVNIDNQIKAHNNQIKELRQTKNKLTDNIIGYVETNSLDDAIVEITDGNLKFQNVKHTSPLTFTFLEKCLNQLHSACSNLTQSNQAILICIFLMLDKDDLSK